MATANFIPLRCFDDSPERCAAINRCLNDHGRSATADQLGELAALVRSERIDAVTADAVTLWAVIRKFISE